ncbi:MAG: pirin family protein [Betaproteobacteria bacterium]|nr:pirin family protein [Betaproteobacteria bacterium]MBV9361435.1 pirin family protein [Betaproteobacteria bacterium]
MKNDSIIDVAPLGFPWPTMDPFLMCVHHVDEYPRGNERLGPAASLAGRALGQDFSGKDGWRMYHGEVVPGFPQHPHRGFETVTIVRDGFIDHSDSLGATARFGHGDVQWLTAGAGINHSEMFPLLEREKPNRLELFQIWVNLPARSKLAKPYFTMLWDEQLPRVRPAGVEIVVTAGALPGVVPLAPPPDSWAANPESDFAIWNIEIEPNAEWTLPAARDARAGRVLYFFAGDRLAVGGRELANPTAVQLRADRAVRLAAHGKRAELLLLQGRPIGEPVAQHGPFVMNTRAELEQAFADYRRTEFGGWPYPANDPVFPRERGRFARHADGRLESPDGSAHFTSSA